MVFLSVRGAATAGELATRTGLTTGAITRMIDRLLRGGFVRREHDEQDRRRVIITAVPERIDEIAPHYEMLAKEFADTMSDYTDEQLELILELFQRLHETSMRVTARLRDGESG